MRFDSSGLALNSGGAVTHLSLSSIGYGNDLRPVGGAAPSAHGNRVVYAHEGVQEWYVNGPLGLEQGFTVAHAPSGAGAGPLTLAIATSGTMRASLLTGGRSIALSGAGSSLRYTDLQVTDARGRALPARLGLTHGTLLLRVDARGARYPLRIDPLIQQAVIPDPTATVEDEFGLIVALSADGNTALVADARSGSHAAAAWVFVRSGSTWTEQEGPLAGSEPEARQECLQESAECGTRSIALSGDGNTALVGAPQQEGHRGAVWVFTRSGSTWTQQGPKLTADDEGGRRRIRRSVALSADGNTALIGGRPTTAYRRGVGVHPLGGTWTQQGSKLTAPKRSAKAISAGASRCRPTATPR